MAKCYPPIEPDLYQIDFKPINSQEEKQQSSNLYVIEVHVKKGLENVYWLHKDKPEAYIKLYGSVAPLPPPLIEQRIRSGRQSPPDPSVAFGYDESKSEYSPRDKQCIKASRPTIELTCYLPRAFGKSYGEIKFKTLLERNLRVHLTHKDLLGNLMLGLKTPLSKMIRPYLHQIDEELFKVTLGQTIIRLSQDEVYDLCDCIDEVCQTYKQIVMNAEDILQTKYYEPVTHENVYGFLLMRVRAELWALMHEFSHQFDYGSGESAWHIFHRRSRSIRIGRSNDDHAFIHPVSSIEFSPPEKVTSFVDLLYEVNDSHLVWKEDKHNWQTSVGKKGIWTAQYTKEWIINKFIPTVLHYYNKQIPKKLLKEMQKIDDWQINHIPFSQIIKPQDLSLYVYDIQTWFSLPRRITANLILPYYEALTDLIQFANLSDIAMDYVSNKLDRAINCNLQRGYRSLQEVRIYLTRHIQKVDEIGFEEASVADDISRIFIAILEEGEFHKFGQSELNQAISVIETLWHESRFENYYVFPYLRQIQEVK